MMPPVQIYYALFLGKPIADIRERFAKVSDGKIELLTSVEEGHHKAGVFLAGHSISERPPPNDMVLAHFGRGFDDAAPAALKQTKAAVSLTGVGPFDSQHKLLRDLITCIARLARELDAFVFDGADYLTFTPPAFQGLRAAEIEAGQLSPAQFGVRAYRVDGGLRSVSMGLEKFGHPNLALTHFSEHQMQMMDCLMTLAMQHIIEANKRLEPGPLRLSLADVRNPRIKERLASARQPGASGKATLQLRSVAPLKGDPEELLAPAFAAPPGPELWAEQGELLKQLFGADRHVSTNVDMGDRIQEAIEKARAEALKILAAPKEWQQKGRRLRVAVGLENTREVVWLEVTAWKNGKGQGILLSQPRSVPALNSGDTVSFSAEALMDYTLSNPEGVLASGGVDELVRQQQGRR